MQEIQGEGLLVENSPEEGIKSFIEAHQELITEAQALFQSEDLSNFFKIKDSLNRLSEEYNRGLSKKSSSEELLPDAILHEVVGGEEYIEREEQLLNSINGSSGIYRPHDSGGGGDFWQKKRDEAGVGGEAHLADIVGHGLTSVARKAFVFKALRLLKERPVESVDIFQKLDAFLEGMPFGVMTEYVEVKIKSSEAGSLNLAIEAAGGIRMFIRQKDTGKWEIVKGKIGGNYPPIGLGMIQGMQQQTQVVDNVGENADIYLSSDGLWEMEGSGGKGSQFQDELANFLSESEGLDPDAFHAKLTNLIAEAEGTGRVGDDVTILRLQVVDGKLV